MRLSDIMGHADLATWAERGLVIFLVVFGVVALITLFRRDREAMDAAAATPLQDGTLNEEQATRQSGARE